MAIFKDKYGHSKRLEDVNPRYLARNSLNPLYLEHFTRLLETYSSESLPPQVRTTADRGAGPFSLESSTLGILPLCHVKPWILL